MPVSPAADTDPFLASLRNLKQLLTDGTNAPLDESQSTTTTDATTTATDATIKSAVGGPQSSNKERNNDDDDDPKGSNDVAAATTAAAVTETLTRQLYERDEELRALRATLEETNKRLASLKQAPNLPPDVAGAASTVAAVVPSVGLPVASSPVLGHSEDSATTEAAAISTDAPAVTTSITALEGTDVSAAIATVLASDTRAPTSTRAPPGPTATTTTATNASNGPNDRIVSSPGPAVTVTTGFAPYAAPQTMAAPPAVKATTATATATVAVEATIDHAASSSASLVVPEAAATAMTVTVEATTDRATSDDSEQIKPPEAVAAATTTNPIDAASSVAPQISAPEVTAATNTVDVKNNTSSSTHPPSTPQHASLEGRPPRTPAIKQSSPSFQTPPSSSRKRTVAQAHGLESPDRPLREELSQLKRDYTQLERTQAEERRQHLRAMDRLHQERESAVSVRDSLEAKCVGAQRQVEALQAELSLVATNRTSEGGHPAEATSSL